MRGLPILLAALALTPPAAANLPAGPSSPPPPSVLRAGAHGQKVKDLQWLLGAHRPNVFTAVHRTFAGKPNGLLGARTAAAIEAYKFRLGYPIKNVQPLAGPYFFALLEGKAQRPARWVAIAARRLQTTAPDATKIALKIKALELAQLGVEEHPLGSNWGSISNGLPGGATVLSYQMVTHALGLAWCVSFQQWSFLTGGYGTFALDTAGVYAAADYAAARNWLHAQPKVGALVAFVDYDSRGHRIPGTGHMGYVVKITAHGFASIEGNASNRVLEQFHQIGDRGDVFIWLPGLTQ